MDAATGRLEPLGASQELRLEHVLYQEAGEYRCVAPSKDTIRRLDSLRNVLSVQVAVNGKFLFLIYVCTYYVPPTLVYSYIAGVSNS